MLPTQINYLNYVESKRHNLATEALTGEQNALTSRNLDIQEFTAKENQRHNVAGENIQWFNAQESKRHNVVTENESIRHNVEQEAIGYQNAYANTLSAKASMMQAKTSRLRYKLEKEMLPFNQLLTGAQAAKANKEADLAVQRKVYTKAQTYKTQVDIAQVPVNNKFGIWDRINNSIANTGNLLRGARYGASSSTNKSKPGTLGSLKVSGGKNNGRSKTKKK